MYVFLGNSDSLWYGPGDHELYLTLPDDLTDEQVDAAVLEAWAGAATPGAVPRWVSATDEATADRVSALFGGIEVRAHVMPGEVPAP